MRILETAQVKTTHQTLHARRSSWVRRDALRSLLPVGREVRPWRAFVPLPSPGFGQRVFSLLTAESGLARRLRRLELLGRRCSWVAALVLLAAPALQATDADVLVILEVTSHSERGEIASAAPPRFVLYSDGLVFTGGTSTVVSGRLDKVEVKAMDDRIAGLRKVPGLGSTIELGPGTDAYRLRLPKAKLDILAKGDPAKAPLGLVPLASFLSDVARFHHPSLRPFVPESYLLMAREKTLPGGCRAWTFPVSLASALVGAQPVPAASAAGWPTGAVPASVCDGQKRYAVTLSPLVPGEQ